MNYDAAEIVAKLNRIAVALERHTEVMLEHSGLLQEQIELSRFNAERSSDRDETVAGELGRLLREHGK